MRRLLPIVLSLAMYGNLPSNAQPSAAPGMAAGASPGWWAGPLPLVGQTPSASAQGSAALVTTSWANILTSTADLSARLGFDITQANQSNLSVIIFGACVEVTDDTMSAADLAEIDRGFALVCGPNGAQVEILNGLFRYRTAASQAGNTAAAARTSILASGPTAWGRFSGPVKIDANQLSSCLIRSCEAIAATVPSYIVILDCVIYDNQRFTADDFMIDGCAKGDTTPGPMGLRAITRAVVGAQDAIGTAAVKRADLGGTLTNPRGGPKPKGIIRSIIDMV